MTACRKPLSVPWGGTLACPSGGHGYIVRGRCLEPVLIPQGFCGTLADDDAGSHGIAGGHARHDRAVCDAKVFDSIDLKLAVYDRHRIAPHFRGTRLMMVSRGRIANEVF